MPNLRRILLCLPLLILCNQVVNAQIDLNGNSQSDIWERVFNARDLLPQEDADGDGFTNAQEALVGTDPFDPASFLKVDFAMDGNSVVRLSCPVPNPKRYDIYFRENLGSGDWTLLQSVVTHQAFSFSEYASGSQGFYRVEVNDADSDGDGVTDWEEIELGFDPNAANTDRYREGDYERITDAMALSNVVELFVIDADTYENWPDPAVLLIRRSGGIDPITVDLNIDGTAGPADFTGPGATISIPAGMSDTYLYITPLADGPGESSETVRISLIDGPDYDLGSSFSGTVTIHDSGSGVSDKEAGRLLAQTSFGATDAEIAAVRSLGLEGWIDAQIALPADNLLRDATEAAIAVDAADPDVGFYGSSKLVGWWDLAMHAEDQLRQRVAFALSQILVVSDDAGMIDGEPVGMASYYDIFLRNAFGNYRDILGEVTYHPVMGIYLSHKGNRAPDPAIGRFPDENYAREIMQLFSIGLWMLHPDGTRMLDANGEPIPTYTNFEISELARVFTGMNWGTNDPLYWWARHKDIGNR